VLKSALGVDGAKTLTATVADAAGNVGTTAASLAVTVDILAPTITTAVISGTTSAGVDKTGTLVAGDKVKVVLNSSEAVTGLTTGDKVVLTVGSTDVNAFYVSSSGNAHTFSYTVAAGNLDADGVVIKSLTTAVTKDAAGNSLSSTLPLSTGAVNVDAAAPTVTITDNVVGTASNQVVVFTYTFSEAVTGFDASKITVANGTKGTFTAATGGNAGKVYTLEVTPTTNSNTDITLTTITTGVTDVVNNVATEPAVYTQTVQGFVPTLGGSINLGGTNGKLIGGFQVLGKWYYYWDKSGDGVANDNMSMDTLEILMKGSSSGTVVTESSRDFSLGALRVLLPTRGTTSTSTYAAATNWGSSTTGADTGAAAHPSGFTDYAAIWDYINDIGNGSTGSAPADAKATMPSGWAAGNYWTSTQGSSAGQHWWLNPSEGYQTSWGDDYTGAGVILQVLSPAVVMPYVVITDNVAGIANGPVTFNFAFSKAVTGFDVSKLTVSGGTVSTFTKVSDMVYTLVVTPPANSTTSISVTTITAGVTDSTGNVAVAPEVYTQVVDNVVPTITTTTLSAAENGTAVGSLAGTDSSGISTWALGAGGADNDKFTLATNGALTMKAAADFEAPSSVAGTNAYTVKVNATDAAGNTSTKDIIVNVTNVNEVPTVVTPLVDQNAVLGQAFTYTFGAATFADVDASTTLTYIATLSNGAALSTAAGWTNLAFDAATRTISGTATNETTGDVTIRVTASDGTLSVYDDVLINAMASAPSISSSIDNNTKFDVRSSIVLTASENVTAVAGKYIHIINDANGGGYSGYLGESTVHTQDILVTDTSKLTIVGNKITLNPAWDLDLGNNYHIEIDQGAFTGASGTGSLAIADSTTINFSTVTPFMASATSAMTSAVASEKMVAGTDAMVTSGSWFSVMGTTAGIGDTSTARAGATFDLTGGDYVILGGKDTSITPENYDLSESGLSLPYTMWVQLDNFGLKDSIYIDDQFNNPAYPNNIESDPAAIGDGDIAGTIRMNMPASDGQGWFDFKLASEVGITSFYTIAELTAATNNQAVLVG
jgi:hypothetical protein